ncbi:MAG: KamA family radical SAM protein [bacterium]
MPRHSARSRTRHGAGSMVEWDDWEWQFSHRVTDVEQLPLPWLSQEKRSALTEVCGRFPMAVTPYYLSLADPDDPEDPIIRQVLPSIHEIVPAAAASADPLREDENTPVKGLTHRYPDRALFVVTSVCAAYCRHCTRKRKWNDGSGGTLTAPEVTRAVAYLRSHPEIRDVLVSGGDPLTLPLPLLAYILEQVRGIPHVEIIRIGTRIPVVLPQRITPSLLDVLEKNGPLWVNTQFNHPREVTGESAHACDLLLRRGIPVSNQTVLLRGVNDRARIIEELNRALLRIKVRPYYLFQCDPVVGTEHFRTSVWTGVTIMEHLRGRVSGLAIPHFVIDLPGGGGKVPLLPDYIVSQDDDRITFRNYEGKMFVHREPRPSEGGNPSL